MEIIHLAFDTGYLALYFTWDTFVFILKGGYEYRRIGFVDVLWKVIAIINDLHLGWRAGHPETRQE